MTITRTPCAVGGGCPFASADELELKAHERECRKFQRNRAMPIEAPKPAEPPHWAGPEASPAWRSE